jgi:hypothetical protein
MPPTLRRLEFWYWFKEEIRGTRRRARRVQREGNGLECGDVCFEALDGKQGVMVLEII